MDYIEYYLNKGVMNKNNSIDALHCIISLDMEKEYDVGIMLRLIADFEVLSSFTKYFKKKECLRPILINALATNKHNRRAFDFIRQYGYDYLLFPQVLERSMKAGVRYLAQCHLKQSNECEFIPFEQLLGLFSGLPAAQILLVEEFLYQGENEKTQIICNEFKLWDSFDMLDKPTQKKLSGLKKEKPKPLKVTDFFGPEGSKCFAMPIKETDIIFVDSPFKVDLAAPLLLEQFIGLDTEWRPALCQGHNPRTSILQLSGEKCFVIIDLIKLGNDEKLNEFIGKLFKSNTIYKVGVAIINDLAKLCYCYPELKSFRTVNSVIDICDMAADYGCSKKGLSEICKNILGISLCKAETQSNWEKRPLKLKQLHYAIADAYTGVLVAKEVIKQIKVSPENYITTYTYSQKEFKETAHTIRESDLFSLDVIRASRKSMKDSSLILNNNS